VTNVNKRVFLALLVIMLRLAMTSVSAEPYDTAYECSEPDWETEELEDFDNQEESCDQEETTGNDCTVTGCSDDDATLSTTSVDHYHATDTEPCHAPSGDVTTDDDPYNADGSSSPDDADTYNATEP